MRYALLTLSCCFLVGCCEGTSIKSVTVRNASFDVVKELSSTEVREFERFWNQKTEVVPFQVRPDNRHFKLDIGSGPKSERWIYHVTGHVWLLTKTVSPVYKIAEVERFNQIVGASQ